LAWAHYRELLSVNDAKERDRLAKQAVKENWSQKQLRAAIRLHRRAGARDALQTGESRGSDEGVDAELPAITPGQPYTYQIIKVADELKIDLGFGVYRSVPKTSETPQAAWKENDIIQWQSQPDGTFTIRKTKAANRDLFTYNAKVISVVDGDTFHALIDLGFDTVMAQRVRLRRIDAPEILTAEGKEAKAALEGILFRDGGRIIMQSRELEQHGRPIADVWVHGKPVDIKLVEQGLAVVLNE
jgi:endonuclease YncB( thermonuclease family)